MSVCHHTSDTTCENCRPYRDGRGFVGHPWQQQYPVMPQWIPNPFPVNPFPPGQLCPHPHYPPPLPPIVIPAEVLTELRDMKLALQELLERLPPKKDQP